MATDTMEKLTLHIVVDKKKNKVLFAEAGKEFVDFILHILYLPLGAVSTILSKTSNLGSVGTILEGLKNLDPKCINYSLSKQCLLDFVKAPYRGSKISQLLPEASFSEPHKLYKCESIYDDINLLQPCVSDSTLDSCCKICDETFAPNNNVLMGSSLSYVDNFMFIVMDDLRVRNWSATAVVSLLNEVSTKGDEALEKREVCFGTYEAIKLVKASLSSKTVLTEVFLPGAASKMQN